MNYTEKFGKTRFTVFCFIVIIRGSCWDGLMKHETQCMCVQNLINYIRKDWSYYYKTHCTTARTHDAFLSQLVLVRRNTPFSLSPSIAVSLTYCHYALPTCIYYFIIIFNNRCRIAGSTTHCSLAHCLVNKRNY